MTFNEWISCHRPEVRNRIARLNPSLVPGSRPRGWHPTETLRRCMFMRDVCGREHVERVLGTWAFKNIPKNLCVMDGKRKRVPRNLVMDMAL